MQSVESKTDLDVGEQIKRLQEFFESRYLAELMEAARLGKRSIVIDFSDLTKYDPEVADVLLDQPEEVLKAAEIAIEQLDIPEHKAFQLRLNNISKTQKLMIHEIRSKHIGKLLYIEGVVRNKSQIRPQATIIRYECPACGAIIPILQLDAKQKEPSSCSCGRKGRFRVLGKDLVDAQGLVLEESPHELEGGDQPKQINVFLKDDLVSPLADKRTNPGTVVKIVGILKEIPIVAKDGGKLTRFDLMIDANNIEPTEEDWDLFITEEEEKQIHELALNPRILTKLADSLAPDIYGYDEIKEALVLQLMGGVRKKKTAGLKGAARRGDIHILLCGDPGAGKSAMLKRISEVAPKARYVAGGGVSGRGLTAAVVKDEFLKGFSLEAGALVLANRGVVCIDELDKISEEDRAAIHETLEQQTVSISKANIQATLRAETTVLAAANPKSGRFDPYGTIQEQINMPPTLISRFDLIFPIKDIPNPKQDREMMRFVLKLHQNKTGEAEIPTKLLRKYVAYAKRIIPTLTDEAVEEIGEYYLKMRGSGTQEGGFRSVPITTRQLEALVRLSEAAARSRLSDKATKQDARKAIELVDYCLSQLGLDPETGKIDIDRITIGTTTSQRNKIHIVREIIRELHNTLDPVPSDLIIKECESKGITMDIVEEILEKLKREGDLFEPRYGFFKLQ